MEDDKNSREKLRIRRNGRSAMYTRTPLLHQSVNDPSNTVTTLSTKQESHTLEAIRNELSPAYCVTDEGYLFANEEERTAFVNKMKLFEAEDNYYDKYTDEVILPFDHIKSITRPEALKELHKGLDKLYKKLYGRYRSTKSKQDFFAVLEFKDKYKKTTHPHWHVLLSLPANKQNELNEELVAKSWKHGVALLRDTEASPLYNTYEYIYDYLTKDPRSYHVM